MSFGYQVLGFGAGGSKSYMVASGGTESTDGDYKIHIFILVGFLPVVFYFHSVMY